MDAADLERLQQWASRFPASAPNAPQPEGTSTTSYQALTSASPVALDSGHPAPVFQQEAGLRVCPQCGKPLHMSAIVCRFCGEDVPRR